MGGVRARKTRKAKVVKIVGKTKKKEHKAVGSRTNIMTGLLDTSVPLKQSYGMMGIASKAGMTEKEKEKIRKAIPAGQMASLPPIKEPGPAKPKHVSDLEHGFVDNLVQKHGLDFNAMSWDLKLNPFQLTATQLKKRILNVIKTEKRLFPELYKEAFGEDGASVLKEEEGDEW
eukprot:TRINITY_DN6119_c0_g1_i1.p2 TRINITY_DN6119_c0_g1~~TRINITY_DN6119_c0_g1_i1.p2  ORF type:complete len:187 (+),score=66.98 TRINITY_DN6119_c0_g1_i1:43-561(+)